MKEGYVKRIDSEGYEKYVEESSILTNVREFFGVVVKLTKRCLFRKPCEESF